MSEYEEYRRKQRERWERERGQSSNQNNRSSTNPPSRPQPSQMNNPPRNPPQNRERRNVPSNRTEEVRRNEERKRQEELRRKEQERKDEEFAKQLHEQYRNEQESRREERERRERQDEALARSMQNVPTPEAQRTRNYDRPAPNSNRDVNNMTQEERDAEIARQTQMRYYSGQSTPVRQQIDDMSDEEDEPEHHPHRVEQLVPDQRDPFNGMFGGNGFPAPQFFQQQSQTSQTNRNTPSGTQTVTRISTGPDGSQQIHTTTTSTSSSSSSHSSTNPNQHNLFNIQRPSNFRQPNRNQNRNRQPNRNPNRNRNRRNPNDDLFNSPFFNSGFGGIPRPQQPQRRNPQSPFGADFFNFFGGNMNLPFEGTNGRNNMPTGLEGMFNQFGFLRGFPVPSQQHSSYEDLIRLTEQMGHVNRGTDKDTISDNSMEFVVKDVEKEIPKKDGEDNHCTVCYEDFKNGDRVRRLNCMHVFHKTCVDKWLEGYNATCPICREPIKLEDQIENKRRRDQQQQRTSQNSNSNSNRRNNLPPRPPNNNNGNMFL